MAITLTETVTKYRQLGINWIIEVKLDFQILTSQKWSQKIGEPETQILNTGKCSANSPNMATKLLYIVENSRDQGRDKQKIGSNLIPN